MSKPNDAYTESDAHEFARLTEALIDAAQWAQRTEGKLRAARHALELFAEKLARPRPEDAK